MVALREVEHNTESNRALREAPVPQSPVESKELRDAGLKVTLPRVKILEILERSNPRHMSAEDMYKALLDSGEEIGLATVYRVLTQFETAGLVTRHHFEGGHSVFEFNHGAHHDHILCVKCGRVDEFVDTEIEARQKKIASAKGYEMTDHSLYIYGICSACRKTLAK
jgi:Fur family ferric uptake transcriptional regulator